MAHFTKLSVHVLLLIISVFFTSQSFGQISVANTTAVTQNFDGMAATTTLPANWRVAAQTASPTWSGGATSVTQQASSGSPATGGTYNWGTTASERAVGAMTSGGFNSPNSFMAQYVNSNASAINQLTISYTGERYRINTATASIQFFYSTNGTSWTAVTAGDIATSSFPTGSSAYSYAPLTTVNVSAFNITGLNIANGANFYLRWNLSTIGANSQGIGIDNVSVTAAFASVTAPTANAATFSGTIGTAFSQTLTASNSPTSFTVVGSLPSGLTLATSTGVISGTPLAGSAGTYNLQFFASNSGGDSPNVNLTITISAPPAPVASNGSTSGTVGTVFTTYNLSTIATNSPTSYTIVSGSVPGLTINTTTGAITGTPTAAGTYSIVFNATNAGGTSSNATLTITIAKGNQTITFNTLSSVVYGAAPGTLTATSSSGLTVSFSSGTTTVATVSGTTITYVGAGSSNITASQAGDANWNAASAVIRSQVVTQKALTITGLSGVNKQYDGTTAATAAGTPALNGIVGADVVSLTGTPTFTFASANVSTGISISTTGYSLTGAAASNYTLTQPTLSANITAKTITLTGATANNKVYDTNTSATITGGTLNGVLAADVANVVATTGTFASPNVGTGIAVTVLLTGSAAGNYTLTQPGLTANITQASQTITFGALADRFSGGANFALTATASSGLTVTYTSSNTSVATVAGSTVTIVGLGSTIITASQAGNSNYAAAPNVQQTQLIISAPVNMANYLFTGWSSTPSVGSLSPSGVISNVTFSQITYSNITPNGNYPSGNAFGGNGSWGSALSTTRFIEFTITASAGFLLNLYSIDMEAWRSAAGANNYTIRSSIDNYGSDLATGSCFTTPQASVSTLTLPSGFTGISNVTFRIYGWGGGGTGDWRLDNFAVSGSVTSTCTVPTALAFQTQPVTSNQDVVIPIAVKAICSGGNTATSLNTGTVTISTNNTGCGLEVSGSPVSSVTATFVNGVATFNNVSFSRSLQSNVSFTTTNTQGLTNVTSSTFNITAPTGGTPTNTTIVNETFESTTQWAYTVGSPTYSGSGSGTDVTGIKTISSNKSLCKSYSINNSASEKRSTTTITFANQNISAYSYATFSFQLASLGSGSGAGVDGGDDYVLQISLDGGTTWSTTFTYYGNNDYTFPFSTTPVTSLNYNSNASYTSGTKSAFSIQLPNNTSQFRFRVTATNNRTNENWALDNVQLVGTTIPTGAQLVLPTATGGSIATCPNTNNTLSIITANTVGAVTYSWSPTTNMTPATGDIANPVVNPSVGTTYTATITDADGCKATASQVITVPTGTAGTWVGTDNSDWFQCRNWGDGVVPTSTTNVIIPTGVTNLATIDPLSSFAAPFSGIAYTNNITVNTAASLLTINFADLQVAGNWLNNGTFGLDTSTVTFTGGSGTATIDGAGAQAFNNLTIGKSVQLLKDVSTSAVGVLAINNTLDLNQKVLTVSNPANTAITRNSPGYVKSETQNGSARLLWQIGNYSYSDDYIFPMGNANGNYLPVTFKINSGNIGLAGIATYNSANASAWPTGTENVLNVANPVNAVQRFWHLESDQPATTYNADVTFSFSANEDPVVGVGTNVKFQRYNKPTNTWDFPLTTQVYTANSTRTVKVQGITKFSWWGGGNDDNTNPLPIELISFTAKPNGKTVELNWSTATEINNDYFSIQRSIDGVNFETIAIVQGAGNSNTILNYTDFDGQPLLGLTYYRLMQTDFNGDYTFSQPKAVVFEAYGFTIYNSFINAQGELELLVNNTVNEHAGIAIYDMQGKLMKDASQYINKGINRVVIDMNSLPVALYIVRVQVAKESKSIKISKAN